MTPATFRHTVLPTVLAIVAVLSTSLMAQEQGGEAAGPRVSYYRQIRPIFQAQCWGCHQPAQAKGKYVMTEFDKLLAGGESGEPAIVPGKPDESLLVDLITPLGDTAEMPKGKPPLKPEQIELIRRWIAQGAKDDTPATEKVRFDVNNPPVYTRPPIITSLDFSPDGSYLAIAGYHEVFLYRVRPAEGDDSHFTTELAGRLIGMSPRIQKVAFSPDGKRLAVAAGKPARLGEVQIWAVEDQKLLLSLPVTYDTIYGVSWSPDGKLLAFGCADNTVRAIEADTGKEVLYQGAHEDWVLDTVFSSDGSHLISVSRDRSVKLTEVATQRFIDNITSITPGALKGGVQAVVRHPDGDFVLVGGADGTPKLYRVFRQTKRVIGDDANLVKKFPSLKGRIFAVDISPDGKRALAASSLNGRGELAVYEFSFDKDIPAEIKKISEKVVTSRSAEEKKKLEEYRTSNVKLVAKTEVNTTGLYSAAFSSDGKLVAAGGADGVVRLFDADTLTPVAEFSPVPEESVAEPTQLAQQQRIEGAIASEIEFAESNAVVAKEPLPAPEAVTRIVVTPEEARITFRYDTVQFVVTAYTADGRTYDVTRAARVTADTDVVAVSPMGLLRPRGDGTANLTFRYGEKTATARIVVEAFNVPYHVDFVRDVMPVLSRAGCNAGTCHGAAKGKAGFKLSLRGNDPVFDYRAFTDDHAGRRINLAAPEDSLMLLKATASVPHMGGQAIRPGSPDYEIVRRWIAEGAAFDSSTQRVAKIRLEPSNPIVWDIGGMQQFRVIAVYPDGTERDVTSHAFVTSGNTEVAEELGRGLLRSLRRGESPVLARYEGQYASTTLIVMGDRKDFAWNDPPVHNFIDELVDKKLKLTRTLPSPLCSDAEFIRRVYLDLTGLPPKPEEVEAFLADSRPTKVKRDELVDRLVGSDEYVEFWTNKWADLLQVNRKYLGVEGAKAFRDWIKEQIKNNTPYNQFVYQILTASGSNRENPPASYFKIHRTPGQLVETTTHLFLAIRFNCNKCHDHPFERWNQRQYYELAAFFGQVHLKPDPASGNRRVGGTAVEGAKPLFEIVEDADSGAVTYGETQEIAPPKFPFTCEFEAPEDAPLRVQLAAWLTSPDNPYFARSYVNRVWAYLMGRGFIEPIDDIRAGNPPTNPELLDRLTEEFIKSGWDVQHLMKLICKSRTYQLSSETNKWNEDDQLNYSHYIPKRLPAEALLDAIFAVTGSTPKFPGASPGTRAAALLDPAQKDPNGFLDKFGRPPRESPCECERSTNIDMGAVLALISSEVVENAIVDPNNAITKLVQEEQDDAALVNKLFLRVLNRPARPEEIKECVEYIRTVPEVHKQLVARLQQLEEKYRPQLEKLESQRQQRIAEAKAALETYKKEIAPKVEKLTKERNERIAAAEAALKAYEEALPERLSAWITAKQYEIAWKVLTPAKLEVDGPQELVAEDGGVIFSKGGNGKGTYKVTAEADLGAITALRLDVLTDDRLPNKGPGRASNGNFVLSELEVFAAPKDNPEQKVKVRIASAQADFSQQNYAVASAIDGKVQPRNNGWAIVPQTGKDHVAVFVFAEPVQFEGGTILTIHMNQSYADGQHSIGKFKLSVTGSTGPILLKGLPENIAKILEKPMDQWSEEDQKAVRNFYKENDPEFKRLQAALAEAKRPLPEDPKLKELEAKLAEAERPVPVPRDLAEARRAVELSKKDLEKQRLTAAQDIVWALINTPEFLFNH